MFSCKVRVRAALFARDDHSDVQADVIYAALVMLPLEFKFICPTRSSHAKTKSTLI